MQIETIITLLVSLGGGIAVWVSLNKTVAKLEVRVDHVEKQNDALERRLLEDIRSLREAITQGFESSRKEMRHDMSEMKNDILEIITSKIK